MSIIKIVHKYTYGGQECQNVHHFYNTSAGWTNAMLGEMLDNFLAHQLPGILGIQVSQAVGVELVASPIGVPISVSEPITSQVGALTVANDDIIPAELPLNVRRYVGDVLNSADGTPYTGNRPVRRGRMFLSGLPKSFMDVNGFMVPSALATAFGTFMNRMNDGMVTAGGVNWTPVVPGYPLDPLPASPTYPSGRPGRGFVVGVISSVGGVEFTKLGTRDG